MSENRIISPYASISSTLVNGQEKLAIDNKIETLIKGYNKSGSGMDMILVVRNKAGSIYRKIIVTGMPAYAEIAMALNGIGLTDSLAHSVGANGIDSDFTLIE
jgi:hypothetical protein